MDPNADFSGPIRPLIRQIFHLPQKKVVKLPHLSVQCPGLEDILGNCFLRELAEQVLRRTAYSSYEMASEGSSWLDIIPRSLRTCEEDIVNYLGMVVAIDFRHWGEKECVRSAQETVGAHEPEMVEVVPFYCLVTSTSINKGDLKHAESGENVRNAPNSADNTVAVMRGSAAMMYLLRRAVEEYHIPWYSPAFLTTFCSVEEAVKGLNVCFLGCMMDQVTPMYVPAVEERVTLLISLAKTLTTKKLSFYDILRSCNGLLFSSSRTGFLDALQKLHPRYWDVSKLRVSVGTIDSKGEMPKEEETILCFPLLKLSQLTCIAISDALKAFWYLEQTDERVGKTFSWLDEAKARVTTHQQEKIFSEPVFYDEEELSICCDYQVPKALRAAGIMQFDSYLTDLVAQNIILRSGEEEEAAIRVGSLVAAEILLHCFEQYFPELSQAFDISICNDHERRTVTAQTLDYALWLAGRSLSSMSHHLCRTIMY